MFRNCLCCSLQTGVIITGSLHLVCVISYIIRYFIEILTGVESYGIDGVFSMLMYSTIIVVAISFLLYGASRKSRQYLLPWLIIQCVALSYVSIIVVVASILLSPLFLLFLLVIVLSWYLWCVVYSYWKVLGEEEEELRSRNMIPLAGNYVPPPSGQVAIHIERCPSPYTISDPSMSCNPPPYPVQQNNYPGQPVYSPQPNYPVKH